MPKNIEKRVCPVCKESQPVKDDPNYDVELLAMGSNDAGLKFEPHNANGKPCKGSGIVLQ